MYVSIPYSSVRAPIGHLYQNDFTFRRTFKRKQICMRNEEAACLINTHKCDSRQIILGFSRSISLSPHSDCVFSIFRCFCCCYAEFSEMVLYLFVTEFFQRAQNSMGIWY